MGLRLGTRKEPKLRVHQSVTFAWPWELRCSVAAEPEGCVKQGTATPTGRTPARGGLRVLCAAAMCCECACVSARSQVSAYSELVCVCGDHVCACTKSKKRSSKSERRGRLGVLNGWCFLARTLDSRPEGLSGADVRGDSKRQCVTCFVSALSSTCSDVTYRWL